MFEYSLNEIFIWNFYFLVQRTALHSAVENEEIEAIKLLLGFNGININAKNEIFVLIAWCFHLLINGFLFIFGKPL